MLDIDMRRKHQDADIRELLADGARGVETLGAVGRRHPDVGDHQLRGGLAHQRQQLRAVTGLPDDRETGAVQQAGQPLTQ